MSTEVESGIAFPSAAQDGPAALKKKKKAKGLPPSLQKEGALGQLGIACSEEIDHSETGKGSIPKRWEFNEAIYNIDPSVTNLNLVEGLASYVIPLWKPKADRIISSVFKSMTSIEPYVQCIPLSAQSADVESAQRLEAALMATANSEMGADSFDLAFHQCIRIAVNTGVSVMYVHPSTDGCVYHEPIHPKDFCIFPHEKGTIKKAKTVGHRYWQTKEEIDALIAAGVYLDVSVSGSDPITERGGKSAEFGKTAETPERVPGDGQIECWQLVRRCDLGEGVCDYIINIAKSQQVVLSVQKMEYKTGRMYFDVRFSYEYGSFWPASSPGQDVQGLQVAYSDIFNVEIQGGYAKAFPPVAIIGATLDSKVKRWGPGTLWELPAGATLETVRLGFDGQGLAGVIPLLEKSADATTGISQLGTSANMPSDTTATAAQGFLTAQAEAKDSYSTMIAPCVAEIFSFLREILMIHWEPITKKQGNQLGVNSYDDIVLPVRFETTGKTGNSTPSALLQKLQMLLSLASQPQSGLDYMACESAVAQILELPFNPASLKKKGPSAKELVMVLFGLMNGTVQPQEAQQILQESMGLLSPEDMQMLQQAAQGHQQQQAEAQQQQQQQQSDAQKQQMLEAQKAHEVGVGQIEDGMKQHEKEMLDAEKAKKKKDAA